MDLRFDTLRARIGEFPDRATLPYELRAVTMAHSVTEGFDPPEATTDTLTFAGEFPILTRPRLFVDTLMIKSFNLAICRAGNAGPAREPQRSTRHLQHRFLRPAGKRRDLAQSVGQSADYHPAHIRHRTGYAFFHATSRI